MTLATHAVTGALVGALLPHQPVLAAGVGFMSHFLLDAIPHWDYKLASAEHDTTNALNSTIHLNRLFLFDLIKIGLDIGLGGLIVLVLFFGAPWPVFVAACFGAAGAVLPDFLQFVYFQFPHSPLRLLQWFHAVVMHTSIKLDDRPVLGVSIQIGIIAVVSIIARLFVV